MNDKEKELWRVIDNVIKCCAIELPNGELSITREDVLGKSRAENLVMTRCMVVEQMIHAGFSITTTATVLNRTVPAVRHLCKMAIPKGTTIGDFLYLANMAYADFYPAVVKTEEGCIKYALAVANDPDGYEGMPFCRWTADLIGTGRQIDWEKLE